MLANLTCELGWFEHFPMAPRGRIKAFRCFFPRTAEKGMKDNGASDPKSYPADSLMSTALGALRPSCFESTNRVSSNE